jgi:Ca2+/Na+ antiporter
MLITLVAPTLAASLWDVRIAIPSTALLTLVFLQQSYRQNLPFLPYITYLDQIYAVCYITTFALFCLFVWASNKLDQSSEEDKPALIARLNAVDFRVQIACIAFLVVTITLNWLFPLQ